MNSHSTTSCLKPSSNFESAENIRSSNVVECEFELCHIRNVLQLCLRMCTAVVYMLDILCISYIFSLHFSGFIMSAYLFPCMCVDCSVVQEHDTATRPPGVRRYEA